MKIFKNNKRTNNTQNKIAALGTDSVTNLFKVKNNKDIFYNIQKNVYTFGVENNKQRKIF